MTNRDPATVVLTAVLAALGAAAIILGFFVFPWFLLFVLLLTVGLLLMLRLAGTGHEPAGKAPRTSSQDDDIR